MRITNTVSVMLNLITLTKKFLIYYCSIIYTKIISESNYEKAAN